MFRVAVEEKVGGAVKARSVVKVKGVVDILKSTKFFRKIPTTLIIKKVNPSVLQKGRILIAFHRCPERNPIGKSVRFLKLVPLS